MFFRVIFSQPTVDVPVNNQHIMNGFIHKVLGENNKWHDRFSDYAISSLQGGKLKDDKRNLHFDDCPYIIISSQNMEFVETVIKRFPETDAEAYGMRFLKFDDFGDYNVHEKYDKVVTLSPILLKRNGRMIAVDDPEFIKILEDNCVKKLKHCGIDDEGFSLRLRNVDRSKVKMIMVGDVFNICSLCSIIVTGKEKTRKTLYNLGFGCSTGCGFGTVNVLK